MHKVGRTSNAALKYYFTEYFNTALYTHTNAILDLFVGLSPPVFATIVTLRP